jgi:hypothetical protein
MKKILLFSVLLLISGLIFGQTQSYLPANPKIVKCGVVTIKEISEREMLIKIVGICEPIKTRVIKSGNRTYYEPVDIQNSVDLATIKTRDDSKYASGSMFGETHSLLISAYYKPGRQQRMIISGKASIEHPSRLWFIKTEQKWTSTFVSGTYKNNLYTWKSHFAEFTVIKIDWLLLMTLIFFFLILPLPIVYAFLSQTQKFIPWLEKKYKGLYKWLDDGVGPYTLWVLSCLLSLAIILYCQWIVFLICVAIVAISIFLLIHADNICEWILRKKYSGKK